MYFNKSPEIFYVIPENNFLIEANFMFDGFFYVFHVWMFELKKKRLPAFNNHQYLRSCWNILKRHSVITCDPKQEVGIN